MVKRSHGIRVNTRKKFTKKPRYRGLAPITHYLLKFENGEKASVIIDPGSPKGQPHHRFHGLTGNIIGMQGDSYLVSIKDGNMVKTLIARPEHLRKVKN